MRSAAIYWTHADRWLRRLLLDGAADLTEAQRRALHTLLDDLVAAGHVGAAALQRDLEA